MITAVNNTSQPLTILNVQYNNYRLTIWCPLLHYGYSYKASCARPV